MLRSYFYQESLLHVDPTGLRFPRSSFEVGLRQVLPQLVSVDDFRELHPSTDGAPTCDPLVLTGMLLLQFRYKIPDEELITRCRCDLRFRYALALEKGVAAPGPASLKRFHAATREKKGADWLFTMSLKLAAGAGLIAADEVQAADSTNTDLQEARVANTKPETISMLRGRSAIERLLCHLVRMGMRQSAVLRNAHGAVPGIHDGCRLQPSEIHHTDHHHRRVSGTTAGQGPRRTNLTAASDSGDSRLKKSRDRARSGRFPATMPVLIQPS